MMHRVTDRKYRSAWAVMPVLLGLLLQAMAPIPKGREWSERYAATWAATEGWKGLTAHEGVIVPTPTTRGTTGAAGYHPGPICNVQFVKPLVQLPRSAYGDARWSPLTNMIIGPDGRKWEPFASPTLWYFTGTLRQVTGGTQNSLMTAIGNAVDSDIVEVVNDVNMGGSTAFLPDRGTSGYILVRAQNFAVSQGTRVVAADFATVPAINATAAATSFICDQSAQGYYFRGVPFINTYTSTNTQFGLLHFRNNVLTQPSEQPTRMIVEQCWLNGNWDTGLLHKCQKVLRLDGEYMKVIKSRLEGCAGGGLETQAIGAINGLGKYLIDDNFLEAATENLLWGGGDGTMGNREYNADVMVRRCHLFKRLDWMGVNNQTVASTKNFYEIKNGFRHVIEGCEGENHDGNAQQHDLVFNAKPQSSAGPARVRCQDIWVRFSRFRASYGPLNVGAAAGDNGFRSNPGAERIHLSDSLWQDTRAGSNSADKIQIVGLATGNGRCLNVVVERVTMDCKNNMLTISATTTTNANTTPGLIFNDNVGYGLTRYGDPFGNGGATGTALFNNTCGAGNWQCTGNVKYSVNGNWGTGLTTTNYRSTTQIQFLDEAGGDYTLTDARYQDVSSVGGRPGCGFAQLVSSDFTGGVRV